DVAGVGDRALIQGELDAERRGLLPGDTLRFRVEAWDNAPTAHKGTSPDYALRLPGLEDLRAATRQRTRELATAADSLAAAQSDLSDRTRDLSAERQRNEDESGSAARPRAAPPEATLPFESSERAAAIARQQSDLEA